MGPNADEKIAELFWIEHSCTVDEESIEQDYATQVWWAVSLMFFSDEIIVSPCLPRLEGFYKVPPGWNVSQETQSSLWLSLWIRIFILSQLIILFNRSSIKLDLWWLDRSNFRPPTWNKLFLLSLGAKSSLSIKGIQPSTQEMEALWTWLLRLG